MSADGGGAVRLGSYWQIFGGETGSEADVGWSKSWMASVQHWLLPAMGSAAFIRCGCWLSANMLELACLDRLFLWIFWPSFKLQSVPVWWGFGWRCEKSAVFREICVNGVDLIWWGWKDKKNLVEVVVFSPSASQLRCVYRTVRSRDAEFQVSWASDPLM